MEGVEVTVTPRIEIRGHHCAAVFRDMAVPRLQLNMGSRLRTGDAVLVLNLKNAVILDIVDEKKIGRVSMVVGDYTAKDGKIVRILACETGMGLSSADIYMRELIAFAEKIPVIQIRIGTAGGVNSSDLSAPELKIGDLVSAAFNVGSSGTINQALGFFPRLFRGIIGAILDTLKRWKFKREWRSLGGGFTKDGRFLTMDNDPEVVRAIKTAANSFGYICYVGGAFSKESLYAEGSEKLMFNLREKIGVYATEMEQIQNAFVARLVGKKYKIPVKTGMVTTIVGSVPGEGFPDLGNPDQVSRWKDGEKAGLIVGAEALAILAPITETITR